jgi:hypothetical protein
MSSINPNTIDGTFPIAGQDNDSQGFRNNFTETKNNFQFAASEITDLQTKAVLKSPLVGGTVDTNFNNLTNQPLVAAQIKQFTETLNAFGPVSGTQTIDWTTGHYQTLTTSGSVTLSFASTWPLTGFYTNLRLEANVTSTAHTLTLPTQVTAASYNNLQGCSNGVITFPNTGVYLYELGTRDGGTTVTIRDLINGTDNVASDFTVAGNSISQGGRVVQGYQFSSPTANVAVTINSNIERLILAPTGAIISFGAVVTLPNVTVDGTMVAISSNVAATIQPVSPWVGTTITPSANVNITAGTGISFLYHASDSKWYKIS